MVEKAQEFSNSMLVWSDDEFHTSGWSVEMGIKMLTYASHLEDCSSCQKYFDENIAKIIKKDDLDFDHKILLKLNTPKSIVEALFCSTFTTELICKECGSVVKYEQHNKPPYDRYYCTNKECEFEDTAITFPLLKLKEKIIYPQKKLLI